MTVLTPVDIEERLKTLLKDTTDATRALTQARDDEIAAKHTFEAAARESWFHPDCPKPTRGGFTVADRDQWIAVRVENLQQDYDIAVMRREAAQEHLRTLRMHVDIVRTLAASVRQAYDVVGSRD